MKISYVLTWVPLCGKCVFRENSTKMSMAAIIRDNIESIRMIIAYTLISYFMYERRRIGPG